MRGPQRRGCHRPPRRHFPGRFSTTTLTPEQLSPRGDPAAGPANGSSTWRLVGPGRGGGARVLAWAGDRRCPQPMTAFILGVCRTRSESWLCGTSIAVQTVARGWPSGLRAGRRSPSRCIWAPGSPCSPCSCPGACQTPLPTAGGGDGRPGLVPSARPAASRRRAGPAQRWCGGGGRVLSRASSARVPFRVRCSRPCAATSAGRLDPMSSEPSCVGR